MKVALNTMVKNEEVILSHVLPIWMKYPVDYFIFYNDNSSDKTIEIIEKFLPKDKIVIINDNLESFNEGYQRQKMIDKSRELKVDYVICLDADELLSSNIV
jgi:glycosyltransferase involved in cell wall biosynthesis